jgi:hypothetical protein
MKNTAKTLFFGVVAIAGLLVARPAAGDQVSIGLGISNGYGNYFSLGLNSGGRRDCGPRDYGHNDRGYGGPYGGHRPMMGPVCVPAPMYCAPRPIICQPAPVQVVYAPAPVVVETAPVVVQSGYWTEREQNVWIEGYWVEVTDAWGRRVKTWQPGHWEVRRNREWVQQ